MKERFTIQDFSWIEDEEGNVVEWREYWDGYLKFVESLIITKEDNRLIENALGLAGEVGEVSEKIKKFFRDGTLDKEAIQKELGDVMFYWVALHGALFLDPSETIKKNRKKLLSRYERGTLQGSGDNR